MFRVPCKIFIQLNAFLKFRAAVVIHIFHWKHFSKNLQMEFEFLVLELYFNWVREFSVESVCFS